MIESRHIILGLGDVSLSPTLGCYYIDMRPARVHYEPVNIYGGCFDERGVPMVGGAAGLRHMPVNIAQYAFMLHADWLEHGRADTLQTLENCLSVVDDMKSEHGDTTVWWHHEYEHKYGLTPPWASAMAQGEMISFYLRMHQVVARDALLDTAVRAGRFLRVDFADGGVRRLDDNGDLWLEEYPSERPSFVLNGFIYSLLGLYDLYRVTGDPTVEEDIEACLQTLRNNLHRFDVGYWSTYDLQRQELVRYYYQKNVHALQMAVLHGLTGEAVFDKYRRRWEAQVTPLNFALVQLMYRVKPRWDRVRRLWQRD